MKVLRIVGYAAVFVAALLVGLYVTFPWTAAAESLFDRAMAASRGGRGPELVELRAERVTPRFPLGAAVQGLKARFRGMEPEISIDRVSLSAHLLPLLRGRFGVTTQAPFARGRLDARVSSEASGAVRIDGRFEEVELDLVPFLGEGLGLPLGGRLSLMAKVLWDSREPRQTEGELRVKAADLAVRKGGKIAGFPVPELGIGSGELVIPIEKGKVRFERQRIGGENVELLLDGEINLNRDISRSTLSLFLSFKPTEVFLKREPLLGALLNNIRHAQSSDGFYSYSITGTLGSVSAAPRRKT